MNCRLSRVDLIMIFAEQPAQILIYLHLTRKYHNSLSMLYDRKGLPSDSQYGLLCHLNQKPKRQNERKWHAVHWLYNLGIMLFSVYFPKKFSVSGLWAGDSSPHQSLSRLQDLIYKHSLVNIQVKYNQRCNFYYSEISIFFILYNHSKHKLKSNLTLI